MYNVKIRNKAGTESTIHVAGAELRTPAEAAAHVKSICGADVEVIGAEASGGAAKAAPAAEAQAEAVQ